MSISPVSKDDIENFTIVTTPRRLYSSGSSGVTGSIKLLPRLSRVEKDMSSKVVTDDFKDGDFLDFYKKIVATAQNKIDIEESISDYLDGVNQTSKKTDYKILIDRFTPSVKTTKFTGAKNLIKDVLMKHYRAVYPHSHWAYTNYHSLNFFTVGQGVHAVPTSSVLLYPNIQNYDLPPQAGHATGIYCLSGAFSFDFHINMRYQTDGIDPGHFKAGTIFHLSSSYALSVVTGSSKDAKGLPDGFRLMLQAKHSANILPSIASNGTYPSDLVFLSDDNILKHNKWHHVVVRWGTDVTNQGTGSFVVDGTNAGYFVIPSGTINPLTSADSPSMLCVGNFYEGKNTTTSAQKLFFTQNAADAYGTDLVDNTANTVYNPDSFSFSHPLKAEIHNLSIKRYYVSDNEIRASGSSGQGLSSQDINKYAFYLPPFFTQASAIRQAKDLISANDRKIGGVYQTPYYSISATTDDPFNVAMAFIANGHYINLENFTRDFTNVVYPRLIDLSGSIQDFPGPNTSINANDELYKLHGVAKRNLTILPCDNGKFDPNYELLKYESLNDKYVNSIQIFEYEKGKSYFARDWSYINLDNLVSTGTIVDTKNDPLSSFYAQNLSNLYGPTPDQPGLPPGSKLEKFYEKLETTVLNEEEDFDRGVLNDVPLAIFQQLRDPSSNQITVFDVSNLFYGRKILPESFVITDSSMSGSFGSVKITLKDDGLGNLYRADSDTTHATQNSVGNIFYDEGLVVIKSPHLYFFGKDQFEISFKGLNNIYTTKYEIIARPGLLNSSSNISYGRNKDLMKPTGDITDKEGFVYISTVNLHDENMNVLARVKLAQPVIKRFSDKILFKITVDS